ETEGREEACGTLRHDRPHRAGTTRVPGGGRRVRQHGAARINAERRDGTDTRRHRMEHRTAAAKNVPHVRPGTHDTRSRTTKPPIPPIIYIMSDNRPGADHVASPVTAASVPCPRHSATGPVSAASG